MLIKNPTMMVNNVKFCSIIDYFKSYSIIYFRHGDEDFCVFMLLRLFIAALWSPAEKRVDLLALVCDV